MAQNMDQSLADAIEIIKDKLYMTFHPEDSAARSSPNYVLFTNDKSLVFTSFFADFGPLDLGHTVKFCNQLQDTLSRAHTSGKPVLYSCSDHPHARSNGAVMICAYMIFVHNCSTERAYGPFMGIHPPFITFRDAGFCINTFPITVLDCARSMRRACNLGHFNYKAFNINGFHALAKLQNGDFSWIVPGKFLAFSGPLTKRRQLSPGVFSLTPEGYVPVMKRLDVSCIVRFNSKCYDRNVFLLNGIRHVDLYYEDGGNPSEEILQAFLQLCETERGAIAVHCKAGLGRTGTNIAAYMMKHYGYTARETMAWCRLCRPGSIVGPQQQYLASIEARMFREGIEYRLRHRLPNPPGSSDEKSVASNSCSVEDSLGGPSASASASASGSNTITSLSNRLSGGMGMGMDASEVARVMTPPLVIGNGHRPKQPAAESLFRTAVSGTKKGDDNRSNTSSITNNSNSTGTGGGMVSTSQKSAYSVPNASNEVEVRRPNTSGGLAHKSTGAFSPLRGSVDHHAASFSYGQGQSQGQSQQNQNYNTINAAGHQLQQHLPDQGSPAKSGHHHHHHSHHTSHATDHQGGPGHNSGTHTSSSDRRYGSPARGITVHNAPHSPTATSGQAQPSPSAQTSFAYVGSGGTTAGATAASGRRSASASRGYQQAPSGSYSLALPSGYASGTSSGASSPKVEYYDNGRSAGAGDREGGRLRFASMPQDAPSQSNERYLQQRPGTSGGTSGSRHPSTLGSANHAALNAAYQVKQSSHGASGGSGNGSGGQRVQNFASFDASGVSTGYSSLQSNAVAVRPRTSGGFLPSTSNSHNNSGGGGQGRSVSNGRGASAYRKRF